MERSHTGPSVECDSRTLIELVSDGFELNSIIIAARTQNRRAVVNSPEKIFY